MTQPCILQATILDLGFREKIKTMLGAAAPNMERERQIVPASVCETECSRIVAHLMCSNPNSRQSGHNTSSHQQGRVFA